MNIRALIDRLLGVFRRPEIEHELDEEIQAHILMATEANLQRGMSLQDARHAARRSFGGVDQVKELYREGQGLPALESILNDFRFASRSLKRQAHFSVAAIIALALGIGACTVVFSVINAVLLVPLPYPNPEQLVLAYGSRDSDSSAVSPPDFLDYRAQNRSFAQFAAMSSNLVPMTLTDISEPERVQVASVSGNFFDVFGVPPLLGRTLSAEHEIETPAVAVISHALWQNRYGNRDHIVGGSLRLNGGNFTIVGVMPADFRFPNNPDVWVPLPLMSPQLQSRGAHQLISIGRLKDSVTVNAAQQEMDAIALKLAQEYPDTNKGYGLRLEALHEGLNGSLQSPLLILLTAVGLLLLLACANVANLMMARGTTRRRELATRVALGAGRARLIRLLMSETVVLASVGGALGALLALWTMRLLAGLPVELIPGGPPIPGLSEASMDLRVLAFTFAVCVLTIFLVGLFPAFQTAGLSAMESLRSSSGAVGRYRRQLASKCLVISEIAISVILLVGAGLVFRSLLNVLTVDPGFNSAQVLTLQMNPQVSSDAERRAHFVELLDQVQRIPGVEAAGLVSELPLSGYSQEWYFDIEARPAASPTERPLAGYRRISAGYFRAMDIPLRRGREFNRSDVDRTAAVAIVDERLAEMYFPDEDPLGKHIVYGTTPYEIVGIVGNVLHYALFQELFFGGAFPTVYTPDLQTGGTMPTLVVRTAGLPVTVVNPLRDTLQRVDRNLPLSNIQPYDEIVSAGLLLPRFGTLLLAIFSGIGLVLAAVGVYGVQAFATARRTGEIGLRMALGSRRQDVLKLVVFDGMKLSIPGVILGLIGAHVFSRLLSSVLFDVPATDPVTFLLVPLALMTVAFVASYLPARKAAAIDPVRALRHD